MPSFQPGAGEGAGSSGGQLPVDDTIAIVQDPADITKQVRIDAGLVTTATTRVLTMPDADITPDDVSATRGHAVLAGQAGGQTLRGGTAASEDLILRSTDNPTKGDVLLADDGGNVGIGTSTPTKRLDVAGDTRIGGNLIVDGTTITAGSETVLIADNHLYLNDGYTTVAAQTGGLVVNYLPTVTTDTVAAGGFTAGVAAVSNPTVATVGAATFTVGDLVQVGGSDNDGLYEVLTHAGNVLTIRGIGITGAVEDFTQNQFVTDAVVAGTITKINVAVKRAGTDGLWEAASGSSTGFAFDDFQLQAAALTAGSVSFADSSGRLAQDNANLFWDDANNRLGLGTASPSARLTIVEDHVGASIAGISITGHRSDGPPRPAVTFFAGRGTPAAPADVVTDDGLGELIGQGYAGGAFRTVASITMNVDPGTISATSLPSGIRFRTTPDGSIIRQERMRIDNIGNVGIGIDTPLAKLHIEEPSTADLLRVRQALSTKLIVLNNGNVGVGTPAPDKLFHVAKAVNGSTTLALFENSQTNAASSVNETVEIRFGFGGDNDVARILIGKEGDYTTAALSDSFMAFYTDLNGVATEGMRLTSGGNVGIGTATPDRELDVSGTAQVITPTLTDNGLKVVADSLTTGSLMLLSSNSADLSTRNLVSIVNNNAAANDTRILQLTQNSSNKVIDIPAPATTIANVFDISSANSLTTGSLARLHSNSVSTLSRNLVDIINDNILATGAVPLRIQQDSTGDIFRAFDGATQVFSIEDGGQVGIANGAGNSAQYRLDVGDGSYFAINGSFAHIVQHNSAAATFWSIAPRNGGDLDIAVTTTDPRPTSATIGTSDNAISIKANKDVDFSGSVTASNLKAHTLLENFTPVESTASDVFVTLASAAAVTFSGRPVLCFVSVTLFPAISAGTGVEFAIQIDAGADAVAAHMLLNEFEHSAVPGAVIVTPTAGSHTIRLRWRRTTGSGTLTLDANDQILLHAVEL